jgi:hypothetical protein
MLFHRARTRTAAWLPPISRGPRCNDSGGQSTRGMRGVGRATPWQWGRFGEAGCRKEVVWWLGAVAAARCGGPARGGMNRGSQCGGGSDVDGTSNSVAAKASSGAWGKKRKEGEGGRVRLGGLWRKRGVRAANNDPVRRRRVGHAWNTWAGRGEGEQVGPKETVQFSIKSKIIK